MKTKVAIAVGLLLAGGSAWAQQYLIRTVAGGGLPSTPAVATSMALETTTAVAADTAGNLYFNSSNSVLKVDTLGALTVVAGSSTLPGYSGDGGAAASAQLMQPSGLAVDSAGNLYIADTGNNVIRKVTVATGLISTVAGNGTPGYSGNGSLATIAQLGHPRYVAVDGSGNLFIADSDNSVIRKVTANTGVIRTVAGTGVPGYLGDGGLATSARLIPSGLAVDSAGNIYVADATDSVIREVASGTDIITTVAGTGTAGFSGDGGKAVSAQLSSPDNVAVDAAGNLYIADAGNFRVRKVVVATGNITTAAGGGTNSFTNGPATSAQLLAVPSVALDGAGNIYIADGNVVRKVTVATASISTLAGNGKPGFAGYTGDGGPATSAQLSAPAGVAVDGAANLYISDTQNYAIREVAAATATIATVAGNGLPGYSGDGGAATGARIGAAFGGAVDGAGNIYFSDGNVVRKVTAATGVITVAAGNGTTGNSGDGGPATGAQLSNPTSVAVDGSGNLYIADSASNVVRKVTAATGIITTVAGNGTPGSSGNGGQATSAQLQPTSVAVDGSGNLYIADLAHAVVRKVTAATQIITTVAGNGTLSASGDGGAALSAGLSPQAVAVDGSGNLYIADFYTVTNPCGRYCNGTVLFNDRIRMVTAATGVITTIAGTGTPGYSGDGGLATGAQLNGPLGVAVDAAGNVYIADSGNNAIRMLTPTAAHAALLSIGSNVPGSLTRGQMGAVYSLVVSDASTGGATSGLVTVTETLPASLTLVSRSGAGWTCSGNTCTRSDVLNPGASYAPISVSVNIAADAPAQVTDQIAVSGGGSPTVSTTYAIAIAGPPAPPVLVSPPNSALGVLVAPALVWNAADGAASYDVFFGTISPPPAVLTNTTSTSYSPGPLNSGATYYWQVVSRNAIGTAASAIWSFTTGVPATGALFVPVTPCRVADTRGAAGPFGAPSVAAKSIRSFAIPQSACNIPPTAGAYSLNVTVVPAGPLSFLTLWPTGQPQPLVSTLNSFGGIVVANAAIVPAGAGGAVSVYASDQTDVIVDIDGYFDSTGAPGDSFYAATPCRIADTRNPTATFGGPSMFPGQTRDFPIPFSSCGTPAAASAYSLNVTVVPSGALAFLTAFPTGPARPVVSTLNSFTGQVVANAALVPAGTNGSISVYVTGQTDVILDTNGYFAQPGGAGALSFYPVTPCRVADTRNPAGPLGGPEMTAGSTRSFTIPAGSCYVPSNAVAYSVNVTVVPDVTLTYLTVWPAGSPKPPVSTLNSWDGSIVANAAIVPAGPGGAISVYVTDNTQVILDINGYFAP
jgi:sugar lactone lactonase YvrE